MTYADDLKLELLKWLLISLQSNEVIGTEMQFHDGKYRADMVIASRKRLCAIEIKGPRDDLRRLIKQLDGYKSMFLEIFVAAEEKHIKSIEKLISNEIGLIIFSDKIPHILRKPDPRKFLTKENSLLWLRSDDLNKIMRANKFPTKKPIDEMRNNVQLILSEEELSYLALQSIVDRLKFRYNAFQNEKGKAITLDDLKMLQIQDIVY